MSATTSNPDDRVVALDVLRGVAVAGILFGNLAQYLLPALLVSLPASFTGAAAADLAAWVATRVLVDGKFLTLFSLLFGISFTLLFQRMREREDGAAPLARRLLMLLLFGLAHALLFYYADVLTAYAVAGLMLWPTMRWRPRTQLVLGSLLLVLVTGPWNYLVSGEDPDATSLPAAVTQARTLYAGEALAAAADPRALAAVAETRAVAEGPLDASFAVRLSRYGDIAAVLVFYVLWRSLALFLIGAGLMRSGWLLGRTPAQWGRIAAVVLPLGLVVSAATTYLEYAQYLVPSGRAALLAVSAELGTLLLAGGYLALVLRLSREGVTELLGRGLAAVGRTALTNYIGQSALMALVATHVGLGLFGALSRGEAILIAVGLFVAQMAASLWWLARFRMGPLEWAWRCITYLRGVPLRGAAGIS